MASDQLRSPQMVNPIDHDPKVQQTGYDSIQSTECSNRTNGKKEELVLFEDSILEPPMQIDLGQFQENKYQDDCIIESLRREYPNEMSSDQGETNDISKMMLDSEGTSKTDDQSIKNLRYSSSDCEEEFIAKEKVKMKKAPKSNDFLILESEFSDLRVDNLKQSLYRWFRRAVIQLEKDIYKNDRKNHPSELPFLNKYHLQRRWKHDPFIREKLFHVIDRMGKALREFDGELENYILNNEDSSRILKTKNRFATKLSDEKLRELYECHHILSKQEEYWKQIKMFRKKKPPLYIKDAFFRFCEEIC